MTSIWRRGAGIGVRWRSTLRRRQGCNRWPGCDVRLLSRTSKCGGGSRPGRSCFFRDTGRMLEVYFLVGLDDLLSTDFHSLKTNHFVANKAHKLDIFRRVAVNPLLPLCLFLALAHLLRRSSL